MCSLAGRDWPASEAVATRHRARTATHVIIPRQRHPILGFPSIAAEKLTGRADLCSQLRGLKPLNPPHLYPTFGFHGPASRNPSTPVPRRRAKACCSRSSTHMRFPRVHRRGTRRPKLPAPILQGMVRACVLCLIAICGLLATEGVAVAGRPAGKPAQAGAYRTNAGASRKGHSAAHGKSARRRQASGHRSRSNTADRLQAQAELSQERPAAYRASRRAVIG